MGIAFESFNFDQFDVVISVTHEFSKAIITKPKTLHLCYCLTPTSYLWSGYQTYFSAHSQIFRDLSLPMIQYLRFYDKIVCHRPDKYIAISRTVKDRINKYYGEPSELVYPPVTLDTSGHHLATGNLSDNFFLIVSRLVPNKKIDIAIEAFNRLKLPLKIIGTGRDERRLQSLAKGNTEFLGHLTSAELSRYYETCRAVVIPGQEDFGLVSVEAQGFGKPVVAFGQGGSTETVIAGKTGWFFDRQDAESLASLLERIDPGSINPQDCQRNAQKFSSARFKKAFLRVVQRSYDDWTRKHIV